MSDRVLSIDCPNCGAGLDVLGGGRVATRVCGYCGAQLDASDGFRVLSVFADMARPASPFALGMEGAVDGVAFTVIGTLGQSERWEGREWRWVDHQIFSPTHGYAWLTVEDGHVLLTRKVRDGPAGFLTAAEVERAETRPTRGWRGRTYLYYATSEWRTDFVEGSFNFRPAKGDRGTTVAMMPRGRASDMLQFVEGAHGGAEREVEVTRYAPELAAAFGAEAPAPEGVHPLQPHRASRHARFLRWWFGGMALAALAAMIVVGAGVNAGRQLLHDGPLGASGITVPFEIEAPGRPARIGIGTQVDNRWTWVALSVTAPDGTGVFETGREIGYFHGGSGDDSWSEGSRSGDLVFVPPVAGTYLLRAAVTEGDRAEEPVRIRLRERQPAQVWLLLAAGLFFVGAILPVLRGWVHRGRRWAGGDWTEDD